MNDSYSPHQDHFSFISTNRLEAMEKLPNAALYDTFAYHTALLCDFSRGDYIGNAASLSASLGRRRRWAGSSGGGGSVRVKRSTSLSRRFSGTTGLTKMTGSNRSTSSSGGRQRGGGHSRGRHSVHGSNVYAASKAMAEKIDNTPAVPASASMVEA